MVELENKYIGIRTSYSLYKNITDSKTVQIHHFKSVNELRPKFTE